MKRLAYQFLNGNPAEMSRQLGNADVFLAAVINQKAVNQNAQQALVAVAAQVLNVIEAQFGFATNDDSDQVFFS